MRVRRGGVPYLTPQTYFLTTGACLIILRIILIIAGLSYWQAGLLAIRTRRLAAG